MKTKQIEAWTSSLGTGFTDRWNIPLSQINSKTKKIYGNSALDLFKETLDGTKITSVLEVGCNTGRKLEMVSKLGSFKLYGIDPQLYALKKGRRRLTNINFIEGSAFELPFKDNFFDLVYTYEVLIHIAPKDLPQAMSEIQRVSKKYILGMEYFTSELEEVTYRGRRDILWKQDFEKKYKDLFPDSKTKKSKILDWNKSIYGVEGLRSKLFLLEKSQVTSKR